MTSLEVGIVSGNSDRLVAFYRQGLGFTVERVLQFPQGTVQRLRRDEARLKIYQPAGGVGPRRRAHPWHQFAGICYAALHVDDPVPEVARAVAAGASILVPLNSHRPGAWFAMIADPEGNVWELLHESVPDE
jgi:predicted enzyme related to lactoylglutathione lyase